MNDPVTTGAPYMRNRPRGEREELALTRAKVMALRVAGKTHTDIAGELGISVRTVKRHARRALEISVRQHDADAERYRELLLARLEGVHKPAYEKALAGDLFAIDRVLAIAERMGRLLGTDRMPAGMAALASAGITMNLVTEYPPATAPPNAPPAALEARGDVVAVQEGGNDGTQG